jgi:hypothetical protein
MDEYEKVESYRALYRVRPLIYHVGDIRLWMPIRQDGVVMWFVYIVVFFVFCYVIPVLAWILPFDRAIIMVAGPIAAAYYTVKLDPAGKTVPRYLRDIIHFITKPKWIVRWQAMRQPGGKWNVHFAGYCRPYVRALLGNGLEEWRGSSGLLHGTVQGMQMLFLPSHVRIRWHGRSGRLLVAPMKRPSKRAIVPPALLEGRVRKVMTWVTDSPLRLEREQRENNKERWKVSERTTR